MFLSSKLAYMSARSSLAKRSLSTLLPHISGRQTENKTYQMFRIPNPDKSGDWRRDRVEWKLDPSLISILTIPEWQSNTENSLKEHRHKVNHQLVRSVLETNYFHLNVKIQFFKWAGRLRTFRHDLSTYMTLIRVLEEARAYGEIYKTIQDELRYTSVSLSSAVLSEFVKALGRAKMVDEALSVFYRAKGRNYNFKPTTTTYNSVILMLMQQGQHQIVDEVYANMCNEGKCFPDITTYCALIYTYERLGRYDSAIELFDEMKDEYFLQPTEKIYATLLGIYYKVGKVENAVILFKEMKQVGCSPTVYTYTKLIKGLGKAGMVDEAYGLYKKMLRDGLTPDVVLLINLMNMLRKAGRVKELTNVFKKSRINELEQSISDLRAEIGVEDTRPPPATDEPKTIPAGFSLKGFIHKLLISLTASFSNMHA